MKYSRGFLREVARFDSRGLQPGRGTARTEVGLRQFYDYESSGIKPDAPDPYFTALVNGKAWWEWTLNQYADLRENRVDWPGWLQLALDFKDDPSGFRQVRQRCNCPPCDPSDIIGLSDFVLDKVGELA